MEKKKFSEISVYTVDITSLMHDMYILRIQLSVSDTTVEMYKIAWPFVSHNSFCFLKQK